MGLSLFLRIAKYTIKVIILKYLIVSNNNDNIKYINNTSRRLPLLNKSKGENMINTIKVKFRTDKKCLPRDMAKVLVSFIKGSVQRLSPEKYHEWYEEKNSRKSFCWSSYYPGVNTHDEILEINDNWFAVNISTPDPDDYMLLFTAIRNRTGEVIPIKNNSIRVVNVRSDMQPPIDTNRITAKVESPVIVRGKNKNFLTQSDADFVEALNVSIESLLSHFGCRGRASIDSALTGSVTISAFGPATGNVGFLTISGDKEALNFLLSSGIGAKRSEGFGRLKYIGR